MLRCFALLLMLALTGCYSTHVQRGQAVLSADKSAVYHVRQGDTLYHIGRRYGIDFKSLARRNHIRSPYRIFTGQRLYLKRVAPSTSHRQVVREIRHLSPSKTRRHHVKKVTVKHGKHVLKSNRKKQHKHKQKQSVAGKPVHLIWPVKGTVTSRFGRRGSRMHDGIDIGVGEGTAVHASSSGEVVYSDSRLSGYGKLIIIRHAGNLFTAYAHNQRNLVGKGARVRAGDVIARVGHTGRATGPHLHFEVRQGSTPVDPLAYLPH